MILPCDAACRHSSAVWYGFNAPHHPRCGRPRRRRWVASHRRRWGQLCGRPCPPTSAAASLLSLPPSAHRTPPGQDITHHRRQNTAHRCRRLLTAATAAEARCVAAAFRPLRSAMPCAGALVRAVPFTGTAVAVLCSFCCERGGGIDVRVSRPGCGGLAKWTLVFDSI